MIGGEGGIFAAFPEPQRFQWLRAASRSPCVPMACAEVELILGVYLRLSFQIALSRVINDIAFLTEKFVTTPAEASW